MNEATLISSYNDREIPRHKSAASGRTILTLPRHKLIECIEWRYCIGKPGHKPYATGTYMAKHLPQTNGHHEQCLPNRHKRAANSQKPRIQLIHKIRLQRGTASRSSPVLPYRFSTAFFVSLSISSLRFSSSFS